MSINFCQQDSAKEVGNNILTSEAKTPNLDYVSFGDCRDVDGPWLPYENPVACRTFLVEQDIYYDARWQRVLEYSGGLFFVYIASEKTSLSEALSNEPYIIPVKWYPPDSLWGNADLHSTVLKYVFIDYIVVSSGKLSQVSEDLEALYNKTRQGGRLGFPSFRLQHNTKDLKPITRFLSLEQFAGMSRQSAKARSLKWSDIRQKTLSKSYVDGLSYMGQQWRDIAGKHQETAGVSVKRARPEDMKWAISDIMIQEPPKPLLVSSKPVCNTNVFEGLKIHVMGSLCSMSHNDAVMLFASYGATYSETYYSIGHDGKAVLRHDFSGDIRGQVLIVEGVLPDAVNWDKNATQQLRLLRSAGKIITENDLLEMLAVTKWHSY